MQGIRRGSRSVTAGIQPRLIPQRQRVVTLLVRGELAFLLFTGVCVALHPGFVLKWNEGGMSNYALHLKTAIPYTLAVALLALYSRRATRLCTNDDQRSRQLRFVLNTFSSILVLVMLTSYVYSLNIVLKDAHFGFGTVLIILVGTASLWMFQQSSRSSWDWLLVSIQLSGDVVALLTAIGDLHLLFLTEMLTNVSFVGLLIRTSRRMARESDPNASSYDGAA